MKSVAADLISEFRFLSNYFSTTEGVLGLGASSQMGGSQMMGSQKMGVLNINQLSSGGGYEDLELPPDDVMEEEFPGWKDAQASAGRQRS